MCFSAFLPNIKDALIFCAGSLTAASIFHICEGGKIGSYKGQTQKEILGISPDKATVNALENLSKWEFMQLFYASPSVDYGAKDIAGEWSAKILPIGLVHPITTQITKRFMGDGEWVGKGLFWDRSCYNIFSKKTETNRMLNFNCKMGKSFYDGGDTLVFDYSQGNTFPLNGMKDEVRVVNHNLLIGLGSLALFGGQLNSAAFAAHKTSGELRE
eukprot:CAMPEP_0117844390 /NCGR_PEP_ID=MMETSP0949-20121206/17519_1 /TAXON_ID=44440 /ORGANISM="Chattonella subsalsa, Strain CCMP2191" /LENGTH=213 /DNA_ID=CAMNT_0005689495 /DNA_START=126 /DNA_END=763 /DNA_ORIENTATION=-